MDNPEAGDSYPDLPPLATPPRIVQKAQQQASQTPINESYNTEPLWDTFEAGKPYAIFPVPHSQAPCNPCLVSEKREPLFELHNQIVEEYAYPVEESKGFQPSELGLMARDKDLGWRS